MKDRIREQVPKLVGVLVPHHSRTAEAYYCCFKLILFKPFLVVPPLKDPGQSWEDAFQRYDFSPKRGVS